MIQKHLVLYEKVEIAFGSKGLVRIWVNSSAVWVFTDCQGFGSVLGECYRFSPRSELGKRETYEYVGVMGSEKYRLRGFLL